MITNETINLIRNTISNINEASLEVLKIFTATLDDLQQYKDLEDKVGCSLAVRCEVAPDSYIYTFGTTMDSQDVVTKRKVSTINKEGFVISYNTASGKERDMQLSWNAYKKTWWLKPDRSK